ncbi:hypothetical protein [Kitasatospora sp. NPDC088134]
MNDDDLYDHHDDNDYPTWAEEKEREIALELAHEGTEHDHDAYDG